MRRLGNIALPIFAAFALGAQRPDVGTLQKILAAEDSRGHGADGITPLLDGMQSSDTLIRRIAIRGIGRLQRPELARRLENSLADTTAAIRAEAANAIAQSMVRIRRDRADAGQDDVRWAASTLAAYLDLEKNRTIGDAIAEALGRLPFGDSTIAIPAEAAILHFAGGSVGFGTAHGLYYFAANRATTGGLSPNSILLLKSAAHPPADPVIRRAAVYALGLARALDTATMTVVLKDPDEQVRRLALAGLGPVSPAYRAIAIAAAFVDPSPIVRAAAPAAARAGSRTPECTLIVAATSDTHPYVAQMAIDALGSPCADSTASAQALLKLLNSASGKLRTAQARAHALVALAKVDRVKARPLIHAFAMSKVVSLRVSAASAAAVVGDSASLYMLARDIDHNVREGAINGLSRVVKHAADPAYLAALSSPGYQVVLAAAGALNGSSQPAAVPSLLENFDRLSRQRRENSRDPRMAILKDLAAMGTAANAARLTPYLADFDSTVADTVARILTRWQGTPVAAHPAPLPIADAPLAETLLAPSISLRVTMAPGSGGGTFTVKLFNNEAPATAARIVKLAKARYFDGHVLQRVEPNFVVQGGGPDATEYVGDAQFMRDEIAWHSHLRGTLGISSRGRDTGDAQWFFNLIDNTRLDHDYTVFGEVTSGLDVVERIMAGDVIRSVVVETKL